MSAISQTTFGYIAGRHIAGATDYEDAHVAVI
jgi:hypothetical protein